MIDYQVVKQWSFDEERHSYGERESPGGRIPRRR
jgi:hypothetical protein